MNRVFLIVWAALAISQIIYLVIPAPAQQSASRPPDLFPMILGIVAVSLAVGIIAILRTRVFAPIQEGRLDPATNEGAAQLFPTLIMAWVLAESVAVFGLVLRFMHFELQYSSPFIVAGALLLYLGRPWQARLERPTTSVDRARSNEPIH